MEARIPENESARLDALLQYEILDTPAEQIYDDITFLASHICGMPISAISLIDKHRQWFKSIIGLDASETPRSVAFCAHAILKDETLVVNDATNDDRFVDNNLVTGDPNIRFYAGAPIITEGHAVGTLCVIDQKVNSILPVQMQALEALARQVGTLLNMRSIGIKARREATHKATLLEKELLLDNAAAGIVLLNNRNITRCNAYFEQLLGYMPGEILGQNSSILYESIEQYEEIGKITYERLKSGDLSPINVNLKRKDGTIFPAKITGYTTNIENPIEEFIMTVLN